MPFDFPLRGKAIRVFGAGAYRDSAPDPLRRPGSGFLDRRP
jgi:hypothetical protein